MNRLLPDGAFVSELAGAVRFLGEELDNAAGALVVGVRDSGGVGTMSTLQRRMPLRLATGSTDHVRHPFVDRGPSEICRPVDGYAICGAVFAARLHI